MMDFSHDEIVKSSYYLQAAIAVMQACETCRDRWIEIEDLESVLQIFEIARLEALLKMEDG
jgi:hypothetical protein